MLVGAVVNVATTAITAGVFGEEYTLKDAVMAAVTGAVGATGTAGPVAAALISGVTTFISSNKQGDDGKTSLMNADYVRGCSLFEQCREYCNVYNK